MTTDKAGRVPLEPGSRPSDQAPAGLDAPRVDPSRDELICLPVHMVVGMDRGRPFCATVSSSKATAEKHLYEERTRLLMKASIYSETPETRAEGAEFTAAAMLLRIVEGTLSYCDGTTQGDQS